MAMTPESCEVVIYPGPGIDNVGIRRHGNPPTITRRCNLSCHMMSPIVHLSFGRVAPTDISG